MAAPFTKLFASIVDSTIWGEAHTTRIVWVTMLAKANRKGDVIASVPGLAHAAHVTIPEAEEALRRFMLPDPYSRTPDNEGRRIEVIDGGWHLLNHEKYRDRENRDPEVRRQQNNEAQRRHRDKVKREAAEESGQGDLAIGGVEASANVSQSARVSQEVSPESAEADADTEAESNTSTPPNSSTSAREGERPGDGGGEDAEAEQRKARAAEKRRYLVACSLALQRAGVPDVTATNEHLIAALDEGFTIEALRDIAKVYPSKNMLYLLKALRTNRASAQEGASTSTGVQFNPDGPSPARESETPRQAAENFAWDQYGRGQLDAAGLRAELARIAAKYPDDDGATPAGST